METENARTEYVLPKIWVKLAHAYIADTRLSSSSPYALLESLGTRLPSRFEGTDSRFNKLYIHSNSPNPGALGPGTARNSEMSVSGNSQSSTSLYIVSYRHKLLLYMYMYTTIKNTSSVTILWKILCNFVV